MFSLDDVIKPQQGGGAGSLAGLQSLLGRLGGGGARTSSSSTASNVANVSVNPTIVNNVGGGNPNVAPYVDGGITGGSPNVGATANATGSDYLPGTSRSAPSYLNYPNSAYANGTAGQGDMTTMLALGAGALLLFLMED